MQVGDGFTDFYPPPDETRRIIGAGYQCPATLLVQVGHPAPIWLPLCWRMLHLLWRWSCSAVCYCGHEHRQLSKGAILPRLIACAAQFTDDNTDETPGAEAILPLIPPPLTASESSLLLPCAPQFTDDNTDETPEAEAILRTDWRSSSGGSSSGGSASGGNGTTASGGNDSSSSRKALPSRSSGWGASASGARRGVTRVVLPGTHLTPCGTSTPWRLEPGAPFGPAEALAAAGLAALQGDTLRLADRLVHWLDSHS